MTEQNGSPFVIDDLPKEHDSKSRRTLRPWDIHRIFGTEPKLAIIAADAATVKWLWKKARIAAFETAMDKAGKLIGKNAYDPRLRDNAAWDCFHDFMIEHLWL